MRRQTGRPSLQDAWAAFRLRRPQGVAVNQIGACAIIAMAMATHVVLVHPEIHWNTGNAGRTCLAASAFLHLIRPLGFSLDERQVKRAGLDYWEYVEPRVWPNWDAFEKE